jgi:hypothetical protein
MYAMIETKVGCRCLTPRSPTDPTLDLSVVTGFAGCRCRPETLSGLGCADVARQTRREQPSVGLVIEFIGPLL